MDGKGRAIDNIFIERLWRSVKYEDVYLHAYTDGLDLYQGMKKYFGFYNYQRVHQGIDYLIPEELFQKAAWVMNILTDMNKEKKKGLDPRITLRVISRLKPIKQQCSLTFLS